MAWPTEKLQSCMWMTYLCETKMHRKAKRIQWHRSIKQSKMQIGVFQQLDYTYGCITLLVKCARIVRCTPLLS